VCKSASTFEANRYLKATTCATYVFVAYRLKLQQAELAYQSAITGCPK
jgi:hypothetical protein